MTDLLEYTTSQTSYSLRNPASRKKRLWKGQRAEPLPQSNRGSAKELARQMLRIGSAESVQSNLNREILQNTERVIFQIVLDGIHAREFRFPTNIHEALEKRLGTSAANEVMTIIVSHWGDLPKLRVPQSHRSVIHSVMERANQLDVRGNTDAALDLLYDGADKLLADGKFNEVDSFLESASAEAYSLDLLLGLLTVTLPARSKLEFRPTFFDRVKDTLVGRGEYEVGLLAGLK